VVSDFTQARKQAFLARLGGDEFAIIVPEMANRSTVQSWRSMPIRCRNRSCSNAASQLPASVSQPRWVTNDAQRLLRNADLRYRAMRYAALHFLSRV
jgi:GGDEF domain-containing protein